MRAETTKILLMLCAVCSRATLTGLRSDLKDLTEDEFALELTRLQRQVEAALAGGAPARPAKAAKKPRKSNKQAAVPKADRPATRIAFELTDRLGLSEADAIPALRAALLRSGVEASRLPEVQKLTLIDWIETLLDTVPGSVVMDAAIKAGRQA